MDEIFEKTLLFDFYGELLTENQKSVYELYHLDDLSLGEISERMGISRQGVYDTLKRCHHQLSFYEEKLKLVNQYLQNKSRVNEIYQIILQLKNNESIEPQLLSQCINQMETIAKSILEDL